MIRALTVKEITSYDEVGELLKKNLDALNKKGYKVLNVFETKVNRCPSNKSDTGFVVVYDDGREGVKK